MLLSLACACLLTSQPTRGQDAEGILVSNAEQTLSSYYQGGIPHGIAQTFTAGSGSSFASIEIALYGDEGSRSPPTVALHVATLFTSLGDKLVDLSGPGSIDRGYGIYRYTPDSSFSFARNASYDVVITGGNNVRTLNVQSDAEDIAEDGWSIANERLRKVHVAGNYNWTSPYSVVIRVHGSVPDAEVDANNPASGDDLILVPSAARVPSVLSFRGASGGAFSDADGISQWRQSAAYYWQRLDDNGWRVESPLIGRQSSYTLTAADVGKTIRLIFTFVDDAGNQESLTSNAVPSGRPNVLPADACALPTYRTGETFSWSGKATLANLTSGTHDDFIRGFLNRSVDSVSIGGGSVSLSSAAQDHTGSLSNAALTLPSPNTITFAGVSHGAGPVPGGRLHFQTATALPADERAALFLWVCGRAFSFAKSQADGAEQRRRWDDTGLDWSDQAERTLHITHYSGPPNSDSGNGESGNGESGSEGSGDDGGTAGASGGSSGAAGGGGFGGGGGAPPVAAPSEADFDWNVTRDIEALAREHDEPTGMWSDGETLRLLHNAASGADRLFAYDLATGERVEQMEFELDRRNRFAHGIWSDGETAWVSDSGQDRLFAYILASGERVEELEFDLAERNRDPRGIWSDGQTLVVLDAVKDALFGYDPASGELAFEHALDPLNRSPRGIWSDGLGIWISDDGANRVFAYRLEENGLRRVEAEEFGFRVLLKAGAGEARGIWSDGDTLWLADAEDAEVYSFNLPDPIQAQLASLSLSDLELDFSPQRLSYSLELPPDLDETTVDATATQEVAAVSIEPDDADPDNGHQVALDGIEALTVNVTSQDGSRSREYRVTFERTACFGGAGGLGDERLSTVEFAGGSLDALEACALEHGLSALYHFDGDSWRGLFLDAPDFLSRPFRGRFADGVPAASVFIAGRELTTAE